VKHDRSEACVIVRGCALAGAFAICSILSLFSHLNFVSISVTPGSRSDVILFFDQPKSRFNHAMFILYNIDETTHLTPLCNLSPTSSFFGLLNTVRHAALNGANISFLF
jgi:hypothetical protein